MKYFKFISLLTSCHFYNEFKRFFLNLIELLANNVESIVKKEYSSLVHFQ